MADPERSAAMKGNKNASKSGKASLTTGEKVGYGAVGGLLGNTLAAVGRRPARIELTAKQNRVLNKAQEKVDRSKREYWKGVAPEKYYEAGKRLGNTRSKVIGTDIKFNNKTKAIKAASIVAGATGGIALASKVKQPTADKKK